MFYRLLFRGIRASLLAHIIEKRKHRYYQADVPSPLFLPCSYLYRGFKPKVLEGGSNNLDVKYAFLGGQFNSFHFTRHLQKTTYASDTMQSLWGNMGKKVPIPPFKGLNLSRGRDLSKTKRTIMPMALVQEENKKSILEEMAFELDLGGDGWCVG